MCSLMMSSFSCDFKKKENRLIEASAMFQSTYMRTIYTIIQCWFLDGRASILDLLTQSSKIAAKPQVLGSKCLTGRLI